MTHDEEQDQRRELLVSEVLGGDESYPPAGWHEIHGDTGRSAFLWSLVRWRNDLRPRGTLVLPLAEPYDFAGVARWAGIDPRLIVIATLTENLLPWTLTQIREGVFGQVILEGLGFLLGGGRPKDDVLAMLGRLTAMLEMIDVSVDHDVALYATSYSVNSPMVLDKSQSLGGSILLQCASERRVFLTHDGYRLRGGRTSGEYMTAVNPERPGERCRFEIPYAQGPIRLRRPRPNGP